LIKDLSGLESIFQNQQCGRSRQNMKQPQIWHYGLVARDWGEFATDGGKEAAYYKKLIETSGQPALDLGCGTGRLLLPYLQAGLDVDGCDYSQDMLAQCEERAKREGISPRLYAQAMHELDLPRRYKTIFACGVVGLGGERRLTMQAMQRCYEHLQSGGTFAFNITARWNDPPAWLSRLPKNRQSLPEEWPSSTERKLLADGTELEIAARTVSVDPLDENQTRQLRARLWRNGELLEEQVHTQRYEEYGKNELILMLEQAGFRDIQIFGDFSDEPATADHTELIFVVKK
jgi:SAM-dependent methyltransferase